MNGTGLESLGLTSGAIPPTTVGPPTSSSSSSSTGLIVGVAVGGSLTLLAGMLVLYTRKTRGSYNPTRLFGSRSERTASDVESQDPYDEYGFRSGETPRVEAK